MYDLLFLLFLCSFLTHFVVLLNVFPKSIAEQLLYKGDEYQPHLIAEEYKEATILFAGNTIATPFCQCKLNSLFSFRYCWIYTNVF